MIHYLVEVLAFRLELGHQGLHEGPHRTQQGLVGPVPEGQVGEGHTAVAPHRDVVLFHPLLVDPVVHLQQLRYCLDATCQNTMPQCTYWSMVSQFITMTTSLMSRFSFLQRAF